MTEHLFPGEAESSPRFRLPEFRTAPAGEERPAGQLFANRVEDGEDDLPIYSVTINDGLVKRSSLTRRVDNIAKAEGNKKVRKRDIAYNMMRMWQGAFGVAPEDCMVSPAYVVLSPQSGVDPEFFSYLLKMPKYLRLLTSHSQGLTKDRLRLYYKDYAAIPLPFPDVREQQEIAKLLLSIDDVIATELKKLSGLEAHKNGLMQRLFPGPLELET